MDNVSQPKVFEFAKEIGMSPLALMDKIREWKLPVRSHMAELEPEVLEQIRNRLSSESGVKEAAPAKKKKVAKKAAAPAASTEGASAKKVTARRAAPAPSAAGAEAETTAASTGKKAGVVVKKATAKVVIRRKTEDETPVVEAAPEVAYEEQEEAVVAETKLKVAEPEETPVAVEAPPVPEVIAPAGQQDSVEPGIVEPIHALTPSSPSMTIEAPAPAPVAATTGAPAAASVPTPIAVAQQPSTVETVVAASPPTAAPVSMPSAPARKREVVMTSQGPVSGVKSEAPRRNIVGRMDLSRVQPPPGSRGPGSSGGPGGGPSSGPRPAMGGGPRNLRAGFVAAAPVEIPDDSADSRRRFDERKSKRGPTAGPGVGGVGGSPGAREREEEVAEFTATEFRKREMVFQPKKKKGTLGREAMRTQITTPKASKRIVKVDQTMKLSDLANEIGVKAGQLTKALMQNGVMATMNTELDFDTIALIVPEFGYEALNVHKTVDQLIETTAFGDLEAKPILRAPVVTIMGHVDHGKTSLLDSIRKAKVAAGEAGGITQHIGAYQVQTENGHLITFIDTPGHEAFTAMRARGANVTDIAVIVVAADDGVMPQTIEAVSHAKAAGVPIIVAVNKMDKQGANPDRVKQQLTEQQLVPEEWGGETIFVPVSAHTKQGIPELLEQIYLVAEVEELSANPMRSGTGVVIESRMDKGRGPVATLLVQDGTLKVGQSIVVGSVPGRVRSLINDKGERVQEAGPSVPVEVLGLSEVPLAGDRFDVVVDDVAAANIASARRTRADDEAKAASKISLEDIFSKLKQGDVKELAIVLKSDVAGSAEAIKGMFDKLATSEVKVKVIHSAVGGINESDVLLASTAKGIVVGFNVRPDGGAQAAAKRHSVEIKTYSIVYELMDDMKKAMAGLLAPEVVEKQLGRAEVRNTFNVPKIGTIAGCFIVDGKITRNAQVRLVRDGKIVYTGKLASLKRFKDDAKEVAQGFECGIGIENFNDVKVGDVIEAFMQESIVREL